MTPAARTPKRHPLADRLVDLRCVVARYTDPGPPGPESFLASQWPAEDRAAARYCGSPPSESVPYTAARPKRAAGSTLQSPQTLRQSRTHPLRPPAQTPCIPKPLSNSLMLLPAVDSKKNASRSLERLARCCRTTLPGDSDLRVRIRSALHDHTAELH